MIEQTFKQKFVNYEGMSGIVTEEDSDSITALFLDGITRKFSRDNPELKPGLAPDRS